VWVLIVQAIVLFGSPGALPTLVLLRRALKFRVHLLNQSGDDVERFLSPFEPPITPGTNDDLHQIRVQPRSPYDKMQLFDISEDENGKKKLRLSLSAAAMFKVESPWKKVPDGCALFLHDAAVPCFAPIGLTSSANPSILEMYENMDWKRKQWDIEVYNGTCESFEVSADRIYIAIPNLVVRIEAIPETAAPSVAVRVVIGAKKGCLDDVKGDNLRDQLKELAKEPKIDGQVLKLYFERQIEEMLIYTETLTLEQPIAFQHENVETLVNSIVKFVHGILGGVYHTAFPDITLTD
jgi:hypothetical protein